MRVVWCALLGALLGCRGHGERQAIVTSASASPATVPLASAPGTQQPATAEYAPLPVPSVKKSERAEFGIVSSTLAYVHEQPRSGKPGALAFSAGSGPGGWGSQRPFYDLLVDVSGGVWLSKHYLGHAPTEQRRVGRVGRAQLSQMRALAGRAVGKPVLRDNVCPDRGDHGYTAHHVPGWAGERLDLGGLHSCDGQIDSKEGVQVAEWLGAIESRMLRFERKQPFGLELPVVAELSDRGSNRPAPDAILFELTKFKTGISVDANGDVYRYVQYQGEPRAIRRVGSVGRASVQRQARRAELAAHEPTEDYDGGRDCSSVVFQPQATEPLVLGKDCEFGARHRGPNTDAVIAWLYAIDEQAQHVREEHWPR